MSKYTFTFKKDDIFVEFSTADKEVVERQFQIWVTDADDYVHNRIQRRSQNIPAGNPPQAKEEKKETFTPIVEQEPIEQSVPEPEIQQQETKISEEASVESIQSVEPPVFDKASSLLRTINTIQNPPEEEEKPKETVGFEEVLEKSIENPTFEPAKVKDQVFLNLVKSKNTTDKFHYLIITAYYLSEFEKMERFSLKQVNAKLMHNLSEAIDHTTLQDAINQGFIELVPDLTGISEVGEYRLTHIGEEFFTHNI